MVIFLFTIQLNLYETDVGDKNAHLLEKLLKLVKIRDVYCVGKLWRAPILK